MTLISNWRLWVAIVLIVVIGYFVVEFNHDKDVIAEQKVQITDLQSKLDEQNKAVKALQDASDAQLKKGADLLQKAKVVTKYIQGQAEIIYKEAPAIPNDDCKSALILGNK